MACYFPPPLSDAPSGFASAARRRAGLPRPAAVFCGRPEDFSEQTDNMEEIMEPPPPPPLPDDPTNVRALISFWGPRRDGPRRADGGEDVGGGEGAEPTGAQT